MSLDSLKSGSDNNVMDLVRKEIHARFFRGANALLTVRTEKERKAMQLLADNIDPNELAKEDARRRKLFP